MKTPYAEDSLVEIFD